MQRYEKYLVFLFFFVTLHLVLSDTTNNERRNTSATELAQEKRVF